MHTHERQNVAYPSFQQERGFLSSIILTVTLGLGRYIYFKKEWL